MNRIAGAPGQRASHSRFGVTEWLCRPVLFGLLGLCLLACEGAEEGASGRVPVILISLDTVRLDALGDETSTPHLSRFFNEGISFAGAFTEMPFTLTAHASLLTGTAPDVHGMFGADDRLSPDWATLASTLKSSGYGTAAVVGSDWLAARFGFDRGFDSYVGVPSALTNAAETTERGMEAVDRIVESGGVPFLFIHYYDAHSDFEAGGNTRPYVSTVPAATGCPDPWCAPDGGCATGFLLWANRHAAEVSQLERRCLADDYRAGVADLDAAFGKLRSELEARSLWQDSVIVVTSDHGEEMGEHGQFIHAQTFNETLAIPLWIKPSGSPSEGRRVGLVAQLADVAPTILGILDLAGGSAMTGRDLLNSRETGEQRLVVAQNKHRPQLYGAQRGVWKLIHDVERGRSELFHLVNDPAEVDDLALQHPEVVEELLSELNRRRDEFRRLAAGTQSAPEDDTEVLTPEARRRLEALGYVD